MSLSLIVSDTELSRLERMFLISSCKPQKIMCVVEIMGTFVADISVIAD